MPPAAVMFDNDGLLLDTERLWTIAEERLFERHGLRFTSEHKTAMLGNSGDQAAAILADLLGQPDHGHALLHELNTILLDEVDEPANPLEGAVELLDALDAAGIPAGLASNSPRRFIDRVVASADLTHRFKAILTVDDVEHPKPAPDLYLQLAQALNAKPEDCIALEDSPTGVAAAKASGAFTIGVPSLPGVELPQADEVCSSLADPRIAELLGLPRAVR